MRRARLPVCGCLAPPGAPPSSAEASGARSGASPGEGASLAGRFVGIVEAVTEATDGRYHISAQLLANPGDEDLDRIRIAVEILIVDMLDQFGSADYFALVVHQVAQQLVFLRRQLDRLACAGDAAGTRIEPDRAGGKFGRSVARRTADQRAQAGDQFLGLEGLCEIVVGAGIESGDLVRPAV